MRLKAEKLSEIIPKARPDDIERILEEGPGRYVVVFNSTGHFLQAMRDSSNSRDYLSFARKHGTPWLLEYSEPGEQCRAQGYLTSEQVRSALSAYVDGTDAWYQERTWRPAKESPTRESTNWICNCLPWSVCSKERAKQR